MARQHVTEWPNENCEYVRIHADIEKINNIKDQTRLKDQNWDELKWFSINQDNVVEGRR